MSASTLSPLCWTLREIARMERDGYKPRRLLEPHHELWHRVRRKLGWVASIELLHEDLAAAFPTSFVLQRWSNPPTLGLDEPAAKALIDEACHPDDAESLGFLRFVCRGLGLMEGGNVAMLPRVQPHPRALVLPGCGGRIAAYQVTTNAGLSFHGRFIFVADTGEERIAIGLATAELRANAPTIVTSAGLEAARPTTDHVFGIRGYTSAERLAATLALEVRWGVATQMAEPLTSWTRTLNEEDALVLVDDVMPAADEVAEEPAAKTTDDKPPNKSPRRLDG